MPSTATLAAFAISDDNEGARLYLERVVEAGIASHKKYTALGSPSSA